MQRIKIEFQKEEYEALTDWLSNKANKKKLISKTITVTNNNKEEKVEFLIREGCYKELRVEILTKGYSWEINNKNNNKSITIYGLEEIMGVFKLKCDNNEDCIYVEFDNEYVIGDYYSSIFEYKINKIDSMSRFVLGGNENLFNVVTYSDFSITDEFLTSLYNYILMESNSSSYLYTSQLETVGTLIARRLDMFGYERAPNLKNKKAYITKEFKENADSLKNKEDKKEFLINNMIELFYKIREDKLKTIRRTSDFAYQIIYMYLCIEDDVVI